MSHVQRLAAKNALPILTSLRFFAAAEVVLFHYTRDVWVPTTFLAGLSSAGYQAVSFFFVLSGFILTFVYAGATEQGRITVAHSQFWLARAARIVPAYWLGLLLAAPMFIRDAVTSHIRINIFALGLLLVPTFLQSWVPSAALVWNPPAWSLSVELLFYALFPVLFFLLMRLPRIVALLLTYMFVLMSSIFFMPASNDTPVWHDFKGYFPLLHLPTFAFGMALGRFFVFGRGLSNRLHALLFSIGAIGSASAFALQAIIPWVVNSNIVLVPLFAMVIFGGARADNFVPVLSGPVAVRLGEISYSIYILHFPLLLIWRSLTHQIGLHPAVDFSLYFCIVIAASLLSFVYVENPARRWILNAHEKRFRLIGAATNHRG